MPISFQAVGAEGIDDFRYGRALKDGIYEGIVLKVGEHETKSGNNAGKVRLRISYGVDDKVGAPEGGVRIDSYVPIEPHFMRTSAFNALGFVGADDGGPVPDLHEWRGLAVKIKVKNKPDQMGDMRPEIQDTMPITKGQMTRRRPPGKPPESEKSDADDSIA